MIQFLFSLTLLFSSNLALALSAAEIEQARTILLKRYQSAASEMNSNVFDIPLVLESYVQDNQLKGQIISVLGDDFSDSIHQFNTPRDWCDILMLHINTKACTFENGDSSQGKVNLYSGRKFYQPPQQATKLSMQFTTLATQENYLCVQLFSDDGPLGTSNYLIKLEALPLPAALTLQNPAHKTLVRMTFSYQMSWLSRQAIRLYLATLARNKVGFTVVEMENNRPVYIKGLQGIIERNTTRYYLAIKTKLDTADANQEHMQLFSSWYDATQRFKRQLYEVDKSEYLQNKARELENQRKLQAIIGPKPGQ